MSAFQTPGVPLDAKQRKDRVHFWTVLCLATFVIFTLLGIANYALIVHAGVVAEQLLEKSEQQVRGWGGQNHVVYVIDGKTIENHWDARPVAHALVREKMSAAFYFVYGLYILSGIPYLCFYFLYLRQLWEEVPEEFARTTPVSAASFALIPFFHLYWQYVAFSGLYQDTNKASDSCGFTQQDGKLSIFDKSPILAVFTGRFRLRIRTACHWWVALYLLSMLLAWNISTLPFAGGGGIDSGFYFLGGLLILFSIVHAGITVWVYWFMRTHILAFIDIKSSVGK